MNKTKLLQEVARYHRAGEYQKIISRLEALPGSMLDYVLISLLARAYENLAQIEDTPLLEHAISLLQSVAAEGKDDPYWYFRMGYALFYLNRQSEAKPYFSKVLQLLTPAQKRLSPWKRIKSFLAYCDEAAIYEKNLHLYNQQELDCLHAHIEKYFGKIDCTIHEVISSGIRLDICVIKPTKQHNYYTLVTLGMGARRMNVPPDMRQDDLERAELVFLLPAGWKLTDRSEIWYWPLRWMKIMARLPIDQDSWIGWGHSVSNEGDQPFAGNTGFSSIMLTSIIKYAQKANICRLPDGNEVNFYNLLPLYPQELEYKCQYDAESLLLLFKLEKTELAPLNLKRHNTAVGHLKKFCKKAKDLKLILKHWRGADNCVVSDRIMVDGQRVGYCCREMPFDERDSGWRFMAGDESPSYLNDSDKGDVYHLNTVCNYDKDIIALLHAPIGSAFRRDDKGCFIPCSDHSEEPSLILVN